MARPAHDPRLEAAIAGLWESSQAELLDRVALLQSACTALGDGALAPADARTAEAEAHKLAGLLGTFGLQRGTALARELEAAFAARPEPPAAAGLAGTADDLRGLVQAGRG